MKRLALLIPAAILVACFGAGSIAPTVDFATCVATNAFAGKTLAQIVDACGQDVPAVIASLLTSKDPKVQGSPALGEARRVGDALKLGSP